MDGDAIEGATDVGGAAAQIEGLLRGSAGDGAEAGKQQATDGGAADERSEDAEGDDEAGSGDEGSGDDEAGADDGGADDAGADDDAAGDDAAAAGLVEVDLEGQKYKVPKAVADGVLRQGDYTRKTEALARDRDMVQARAKQLDVDAKVVQELAPLQIRLQNIQQEIDRLSGDTPDPSADPIAYLQRDKQIRSLEAARDQIGRAAAERRTALLDAKQSADAELQQSFLATLARDIPNWGPQVNQEITKVLLAEGFSPQQVSDLRDPSIVRMAHKLARLSKLDTAQRTLAGKKVAQAAPVVKPTGTGNRAGSARSSVVQAKTKAARTGNVRDAGGAILELMRQRSGR